MKEYPIKIDPEIFKHLDFKVNVDVENLSPKNVFYTHDLSDDGLHILVWKRDKDEVVLVDELVVERVKKLNK